MDAANCGQFIQAGCAAAAGSSLAGKDLLLRRDWKALTEASRKFVDAVMAAKR